MTVVLEQGVRFSKSLIWKMQEETYAKFGPEAWAIDNGVPSYITSNPYTARQYALIVIGYIKDNLANISLNEPFYIFDLGAGSGRFAYLFIKELLDLLHKSDARPLPLCYVMTDFTEKNIAFWENHPRLSIFSEYIDIAVYKHDSTDPLFLRKKKTTVKEIQNPYVLIANYYFDTIPQDLFKVKDGQLYEGLCTLSIPQEQANNPLSDLVGCVDLSYQYKPVEGVYYQERDDLDKLLKDFSSTIDNGVFTFPTGAFNTLKYFEDISSGHYLLLAGDQGIAQKTQIPKESEPKFCRHTSFSIDVCYPILQRYFQEDTSCAWLPTFSDPIFINFTAVQGRNKKRCPFTKEAWEHMDAFEPCDYWKLMIESHQKEQSLAFILSLTKLGNWDPMAFHFFFNKIRESLKTDTKGIESTIFETIERIAFNFYWIIPSDGDFMVNLGVLCFDLKNYKRAMRFFNDARSISGDTKIILNNLGACYQAMLDPKKAHKFFQKAKELDT